MLALIESVPQTVDWLIQASWQASVVVGAVLLTQHLFGYRLPARWRYRMWALVAIRLMLPVLPVSALSIYNLVPLGQRNPAQPLVTLDNDALAPTALLSRPSVLDRDLSPPAVHAWWRTGWRLPVFLVWLAGATLAVATLLRAQRRLVRRISRGSSPADPALHDLLRCCRREMGIRRDVAIVCTDAVASPAVTGLLRPKLLLPAGLIGSLEPTELRFVILHEMTHLKCFDLLFDWLVALLKVLHWFNPVIWLASVRCRMDREMARDAMVLSTGSPEEDRRYGRTVLKIAEQLGPASAAPGVLVLLDECAPLERRIRMIAGFRRNTGGGAALAVVLMLLVGCTTLTGRDRSRPRVDNPPPTTSPSIPESALSAGNIMIEMRLFRVPEGFLNDALGPSVGQAVTAPGPVAPTSGPRESDAPKTVLLNPADVRKLEEAARSHSDVEILTSPRLAVVSGRWATLNVGGEVPMPSSTSEVSARPKMLFVGTEISVRPTLDPDGRQMTLDVDLSTTSLRDPAGPIGRAVDKRTLNLRACVNPGSTLVCSDFKASPADESNKSKLLLLLEASILTD